MDQSCFRFFVPANRKIQTIWIVQIRKKVWLKGMQPNSSILHSKGNQYLVNVSQSCLRYSKQIKFQEELMNFLTI